jgi:hypothetical protein
MRSWALISESHGWRASIQPMTVNTKGRFADQTRSTLPSGKVPPRPAREQAGVLCSDHYNSPAAALMCIDFIPSLGA